MDAQSIPPRTIRPRYRCPPFTHSVRVTSQQAWIDKAKIRFRGSELWGVRSTDLEDFLGSLADGDLVKAKRNSLKIGGKNWLFSCRIYFDARYQPVNRGAQRRGGRRPGSRWQELSVDLSFNLTRFISLRGLPSHINMFASDLRPVFQADSSAAARLETLDRNDNFVPSIERLAEAQAASWPIELRALTELFAQLIRQIFLSRSGVNVVANPPRFAPPGSRYSVYLDWSRWVLKHLETYWEFQSPDALSAVEQFHARLPRLASDIRATRYAVAAAQEEGEQLDPELSQESQLHSSLSLTIPSGAKNVHSIVYAKHAKRIRFEIRRRGSVRQTLATAGESRRGAAQEDMDLVSFLRRVTDDSASRMNAFLVALAETEPADRLKAGTLAELLAAFGQACRKKPELCKLLLRELITTGRLDKLGPGPRSKALESLEDQGILKRCSATISGRNGVLYLASPYQDYASALRFVLGDT